jgi:hypothetical protein
MTSTALNESNIPTPHLVAKVTHKEINQGGEE